MDKIDGEILLNITGEVSSSDVTNAIYSDLDQYEKIKKNNFVKKRLDKWEKSGMLESKKIERRGKQISVYNLKKGVKIMGLTGSGIKGFAYATDKVLHLESFEGKRPEFKKFFNTLLVKHQKG